MVQNPQMRQMHRRNARATGCPSLRSHPGHRGQDRCHDAHAERRLPFVTAYMMLVTCNTQGELTALERGLHALQ
jgi:hypothetical protein